LQQEETDKIRNPEKLVVSYKELAFQNEEKEKRTVELIVANQELNKENETLQNRLNEVSDYKYALDQSSILAITDQKGTIKYVNDKFCEISKYSAEELIGQDHHIINSDYHPKSYIKNLWDTISKGIIWKGEICNKAKDGSIYWVATLIIPFLNKMGKPYQYLAIRTDITNRKKTEEKIILKNNELEKRTAELMIANKELVFQNDEKEKRAAELIIANEELFFQNNEKEKRGSELVIANKELFFQNDEKEKRAIELTIVNNDLKKAEEKIIKANRLFFVISQINQMIARTTDEKSLFKETCKIAIESGKFKMAWIGITDDKTKSLIPVAHAGEEHDYLSKIKTISVDNVVEGRGPAGTAFREGKYSVCNDIENNPQMTPWKTEALNHGYHSCIALPLKKSGKVAAIFSLYASEPNFFNSREIKLLNEISGDISFALENFDREKQSKIKEVELAEKEFFLSESQRVGNIGSFKLNIITGYWQSTEALNNIFGIDKSFERNIEGWMKIVHPDDKQKMEDYLRFEVIGKQKKFNKEYKIKRINDKQTRWVCGLGDVKIDDIGNTKEMIGTIQDITDRKIAEEKTEKSGTQLSLAAGIAKLGYWELDLASGLFTFTDQFYAIFKTTAEKMGGYTMALDRYIELFVHPDDRPLAGEEIAKAIKSNNPNLSYKSEHRIIYATGETGYISVHLFIVKDDKGRPNKTFGVNQDITERKRTEETLKQSENRFREFFENAPEAIVVLDLESSRFIKINKNASLIFKFSEEELIEKGPADISPEFQPDGRSSAEKSKEYIEKAIKGERTTFEWVHCDADRKEIMCEVHLALLPGTSSPQIYASIIDITERNETRKKLQKNSELYEYVNKATQDTIWEWDYLTKKGLWGTGIIDTFGYSKDQLNYNENWIEEFIHPADKDHMISSLESCIKSGNENWHNEHRFLCADGTYKEVFDSGFILYNENKKPYRMIGAMTDLTEKKKLERKLADQKLNRQRIMTKVAIQAQEKEKNQLGIELHDNITQLMATVKMYLGLLISGKDFEEDLLGKSYEYVNTAIDETRKLSHSLVAPSLGEISLKKALEELLENSNLSKTFQLHLMIDKKYEEQPKDKSKELALYRIVQEQLYNIIKYAQATEVYINLKSEEGNQSLSVSDNGVGFDTTLKSKGIGLKNMNSRVKLYSGTMNVISAPGQGCTLEVFIPVSKPMTVFHSQT
jgi:two-component system sensor histidine kinase UhpB